MKYIGPASEYLLVEYITNKNCYLLKESHKNELSLIWFDTDHNKIIIDAVQYEFHRNQIICLTNLHKIKVVEVNGLRLLRFNKPFYCILDHDSEVGCKGVLYYGSPSFSKLHPNPEEIDILSTVWKMLAIEMQQPDGLQQEMLQMMLKRILILCTRIYNNQAHGNEMEPVQLDIIRTFYFLVESHFRTSHSVTEYAKMLNKSPKTISNLFKKAGTKPPLALIHDRIMVEARRLIRYSEKPISEIGYDLGFSDIQTFSRFFKKHQSVSPSEFKAIEE